MTWNYVQINGKNNLLLFEMEMPLISGFENVCALRYLFISLLVFLPGIQKGRRDIKAS
jgi:hypothetical protein